jgi:acetate kinase
VLSVGCARYGQEAGLEAIRMALDEKGNMQQGCDDCEIKWRESSKRVIIMITDEDSDLPTHT